ncbi:hypothetical protein K7640_18770 [Micromonospora sp. PLK6-60]|uniref:TolB family protein n=1 Tax=Micromonospora sp. PLK6-60 TaxID=2873383 RepID=UPI001CA68754|nr:hypothetical protein [Micromonospora sp. PLK6-60]MBY8873876.1 hypothetical protein [Micromonospora sp. PLK6-60]
MSARLRDALRETAEAVPAYDVHDRAVATARRTRRRSMAAALAALALVALVPLGLRAAGPATSAAAPAADGALPDRVSSPAFGELHATDRPRLGPASVIFSGQAPGLVWREEGSRVVAVGADADRYRTFTVGYEARTGEDVVLSADGRLVAHGSGSADRPRVTVIDLVTGRARELTTDVAGSVTSTPVAWSPDGTRLVVRDTTAIDELRTGYRSTLSLLPLDGGPRVEVAEGPHNASFGRSVAFTPDGRRLAYEMGSPAPVDSAGGRHPADPGGGAIRVTDLDGRQTASFPLPASTWLAGKGAWTPDGRWLTLAVRQGDTWRLRHADPANGREVRMVDPGTGRETGAAELPGVSGVTAIRLLGWTDAGAAMVVGYLPHPNAPARFDQPLEMDQRTAYGNVGSVRVLALDPGTATPRTLLTAPDEVVAVDVADDVVRAARVRKADPPAGLGPRFWLGAGLAGVAGLAVLGVARWRRRRAYGG